VLLVQNPPTRQDNLRAILESIPRVHIVGAIANPAAALKPFLSQPDIVVLHLRLHEQELPSMRLVRAYWPTAAIIVISAAPTFVQFRAILSAGARAYLGCPVIATQLAATIDMVASGALVCGSTIAPLAAGHLMESQEKPTLIDLSQREAVIGAHIATGQSNRVIAQELHLATKTVEYYVTRLLRKTGTASRIELALWWSRCTVSAGLSDRGNRGTMSDSCDRGADDSWRSEV
jgi:DNA-binding NarL/FixJ family response regulator